MLLRMPAFMPSCFRVSALHRPLRAHAEALSQSLSGVLNDECALGLCQRDLVARKRTSCSLKKPWLTVQSSKQPESKHLKLTVKLQKC